MNLVLKSMLLMTALIVIHPVAGSAVADGMPAGEALPDCPASPNCVSSMATDERHHIAPFAFDGPPEAAQERLRGVLAGREDTRIVEVRDGYLRVEFRTLLGFVDDGEFLVDRDARSIQLRSASRSGWWDLGKNRRRMEEIRRAFSAGGDAPQKR